MLSVASSTVLYLRCTANDAAAGLACPCCEYREASNPDPDKPICCLECLHGRSLHEVPTQTPSGMVTLEPSVQAEIVANTVMEPLQNDSATPQPTSVNMIL